MSVKIREGGHKGNPGASEEAQEGGRGRAGENVRRNYRAWAMARGRARTVSTWPPLIRKGMAEGRPVDQNTNNSTSSLSCPEILPEGRENGTIESSEAYVDEAINIGAASTAALHAVWW